jgi:hypothetical protein
MNIPDVLPTHAFQNAPGELPERAPALREHLPNFDNIPRPRLFYCGNITFNRGLEESITALTHLPTGSLIIMGQDRADFVSELHRLAVEVGVAERVFFFPPVPHEHVVPTAAMADIGLVLIKPACLSYAYALPNKMFECMHANLPVVAADLPELRRVVNTHGNGVLCDQESPSSIAAAASSIIESPERARLMRARAKEAAKSYRWDHERDILLGVYRDLGVLPVQDAFSAECRKPSGRTRAAFLRARNQYNAHLDGAGPYDPQDSETLRLSSNRALQTKIRECLPPLAAVAIVSKGDPDLLVGLEGAGHFPQDENGAYSGYHPADSREALQALTRSIDRGYAYLAFPATSLWWLDHYSDFRRHLEKQHEVVASPSGRNDSWLIYKLVT